MNLEQMQAYLQEIYRLPVVLTQQGTTNMECPYCGERHDHGPQPGHHLAHCKDELRMNGIVIGDRSFVPNYGYTILEYYEEEGVNKFINN